MMMMKIPTMAPLLARVLIFFMVLPVVRVGSQITAADLGVTQPVLDCFDAISFDVCRNDTSFECFERFFIDQYMLFSDQTQFFDYLLNKFAYDSGLSVDFILPQLATLLNVTDTGAPYLEYVDSLFGTNCSELNVTFGSTTTQQAEDGRVWWLYLLDLADFCTENEIFVIGIGCMCPEDKNCAEAPPGQSGTNSALILLGVVAVVIMVFSIFKSKAAQRSVREAVAAVNYSILAMIDILRKLSMAGSGASQSRPQPKTTPRPSPTSVSTTASDPAPQQPRQLGDM